MQNIICFTALSHFSQKVLQLLIAPRCCLQLANIKYVKGINDGPRNQQATAVFQTYVGKDHLLWMNTISLSPEDKTLQSL